MSYCTPDVLERKSRAGGRFPVRVVCLSLNCSLSANKVRDNRRNARGLEAHYIQHSEVVRSARVKPLEVMPTTTALASRTNSSRTAAAPAPGGCYPPSSRYRCRSRRPRPAACCDGPRPSAVRSRCHPWGWHEPSQPPNQPHARRQRDPGNTRFATAPLTTVTICCCAECDDLAVRFSCRRDQRHGCAGLTCREARTGDHRAVHRTADIQPRSTGLPHGSTFWNVA